MADRRDWLLLIYTVPRDPSAARVYVWRKLKRLGAIMLQDAVWILPSTARTRERFVWLVAEINELHGTATLWESQTALGDESELVERFASSLRKPYTKLLRMLKGKSPDLAAISRKYQQLDAQDYLSSELGKQVRAALVAARGGTR